MKLIELDTRVNKLGLKLVGGKQTHHGLTFLCGIFVKQILSSGAAAKAMHVNDEIIEVNYRSLAGVTLQRAMKILELASQTGHVILGFASDKYARSNLQIYEQLNMSRAEGVLRSTECHENWGFDVCKTTISNDSSPFFQKTYCIHKTAAGLGLTVKQTVESLSINNHENITLSLRRVITVVPGGDIDVQTDIQVDDVILFINGVFAASGCDVSSMLLKEKLQLSSKFVITCMSSKAPVIEIAKACECHLQSSATIKSAKYVLNHTNDQNTGCFLEIEGDTLSQDCKKTSAPTTDTTKQQNCFEQQVQHLKNTLSVATNENLRLQKEIKQLLKKLDISSQNNANSIQVQTDIYTHEIEVLRKEINNLQASETSIEKLENENDKECYLSLLECECRKMKEIRESHEKHIRCSILFLSKVCETVENPNSVPINTTQWQSIRDGAKNLLDLLSLELERKEMPFGWEKASLSNGQTFFIDHVNHLTSWSNPLSTHSQEISHID